MHEEKTKVESEIKLVEGAHSHEPEISSEQQLEVAGEQIEPAGLQQLPELEEKDLSPAECLAQVEQVQTALTAPDPAVVFKAAILRGLQFTGVSFLLFSLPYFFQWSLYARFLDYPYSRTVLIMLVIWNLIGAALYAQARTFWSKIIAILLFGAPLAIGSLLLYVVYVLAFMLVGKYPGF